MAFEPSNHAQQQRSNLEYLFTALGIDELYERVNALDKKGGVPEKIEENPTGNPMVQKNYEGVGSLSGGPVEENEVILEDVKPDEDSTDKKATSSSPRSTSTAKK